MSHMDHISKIIEDEIEKRVNERLSLVLEKVSRTYDISLRQLMRDVSSMGDVPCTMCKGLTAKGKRCSRSAKTDGYCHLHVSQKPVQRVIHRSVSTASTAATAAHTHTLPPLFMAGCPACEKTTTTRKSQDNLSLLAMCV